MRIETEVGDGVLPGGLRSTEAVDAPATKPENGAGMFAVFDRSETVGL